MHGRAIRETRVLPPRHSLVRRELPRPLAFKEDNGFSESISVVVCGKVRVVLVGMGNEGMTRKKKHSCGKNRNKEKETRKVGKSHVELPKVKMTQPNQTKLTTQLQCCHWLLCYLFIKGKSCCIDSVLFAWLQYNNN